MDRRRFIGTGLRSAAGIWGSAGIVGSAGLAAGSGMLSGCGADRGADRAADRAAGPTANPFGGAELQKLRDDHRRLLFDAYLPFWEKGGYDEARGGFMCYLHDDGSVQDGRKDIWYQGRGIWVYSFLYNEIDRSQKWLDMAARSRDFMVRYMHRGDGTWLDTVDRDGAPAQGIDFSRDDNIYGALFAAVGLIQLARANGKQEDLDLARRTIEKSVERYEDPAYAGVKVAESAASGLRAQGHSFMFVWVLPQFLELSPDERFEQLLAEHLDHIEHDFWNSAYRISNEVLNHDYSRIPALSGQMVPGHSIETQWMAAAAAGRAGDVERQERFRMRMRRLIEMSWDYNFGGIGDTDYRVFADANHARGPEFDIKSMWSQTEVAVGSLRAASETNAQWAAEWYRRSWDYILAKMQTDYGVWRQAVDRFGAGVDRDGISPYRKGNFHQPRCLMMNLLEIERMLG